MAHAVLALGPLGMVIGSLFWVFSLTRKQAEVTSEVWKEHGVEL